MATVNNLPHEGWIQLQGWHGRTQQRVEVVGWTRTKCRIRAVTRTLLAGRRGYLEIGREALVPRHAVALTAAAGVEVIGE